MTEVTVGLDIGTSSVKAIAADGAGHVVGSARVPHRFRVPSPGRFEHDADEAWRRGPQAALAALGDAAPRGVSVAAMVPSLTAVDGAGAPLTPGLLYGDERGRHDLRTGHPVESGELLAFLRWTVGEAPDAAGYWPAQAVANNALAGEPVLDTTTAATASPLFDWKGWDAEIAGDVGVRVDQLPKLAPTGSSRDVTAHTIRVVPRITSTSPSSSAPATSCSANASMQPGASSGPSGPPTRPHANPVGASFGS